MLSKRVLLTIGLITALPLQGWAEDEWFQRQFKADVAPAPVRAVRAKPIAVPAPIPAVRPWRTVVVPVLSIDTFSRSASVGLTPVRHSTSALIMKPLTGYAHELRGLASYYWQEQMTSSGERFNRHGMTAAHKTLPLGTRVRVTNLTNGMSTVVRINDRGPFKAGRVIDLSEAAAQQLHMTGAGIARVALDVVH